MEANQKKTPVASYRVQKVVSRDLLLHENHLPNQDILCFCQLCVLISGIKSIKYSATPLKQTVGICRSVMSLGVQIFVRAG